MAKARVLVLLIFIASETLVLGDSVPAKVPVRDELSNVKESNKQKPTISNSRIDIPPNRGAFRILKSVSSSVSSSVPRSDGEHSDKNRKNVENAAGSADEDSEKVKDGKKISGKQLQEPSSDDFNFDDFLISVTSKNDIKTDTIEDVLIQKTFSEREPVKPMPTKIAISKLESGVNELVLVSLERNKEQKTAKRTPIKRTSNSIATNQSELADSIRSETIEVKRRRPTVMRKTKIIPNSQTTQPKNEQSLKANTTEVEEENKEVKDSSIKTSRSSSKSRRPTILPEKTRRRLFPSRRNLTRSTARKRIQEPEKGVQTHQDKNVNLLTISIPLTTTTTPAITTKPSTYIITESPVNEIVDADYLTYGELYEPAPPEPRYTPTPKGVNNAVVRKVLVNPLNKPFRTNLKSYNRISLVNSDVQSESGQLKTSFQDAVLNKTNEIVKVNESDNQKQTNAESMVVQHGPALFEFDSKGSLPEQFDYTNYEDLVEFYDYPEDYLVNDNSGGSNIYDNFQYGYKVAEKETGNYHARSENRDGKKVSGTYEVALPDGRIQLVNYIADDEGFRADVTYKKENKTSSSELSTITSDRNNVKALDEQKITSRVGRKRVKLNNPKARNSKLKKSQINSSVNSVLKENPSFSSKNSHMTPHPALRKSNREQQRPRGKFKDRDNSIVNSHFDFEPNINTPVSFDAKNEVSSILQNHGLLRPITNTRRGPVPKPIPPHGHREVAKIPPNPFNKKPMKKSHVPVKPQPKLVSTIAPTQPPKQPVHPLLQPGAFNRPVNIDINPERDFPVTAQPLQFPPQRSPFAFPVNSLELERNRFPESQFGHHSPINVNRNPERNFPVTAPPLHFPPQRSPFEFPPNSLDFERNSLPESHFEPHNLLANSFNRRRPVENNPVFHITPFSTPKQLLVNQKKSGKINFSVDLPVSTPSPNPFKVVVERIRPSTYNPFKTHFVTPRTFPLSHENTRESVLNQPNYSDGDLRELSHIELLKTPVNEPIYYEHTGVYSSADYPAEDEELIHRSITQTHFSIPNEINPVTTPRPFFTFSSEKFPSVTTERPLAVTPKSIFSEKSFGQQFTTVAPNRKSKFRTTSLPNRRVTSIIPFRSITPVTPQNIHFTSTPAPIPTTTMHSRPLFFNYLSKNGTPTPTLVYHPDNPIFIHALGQTHAIPLLLPYEGSASEKSETKAKKTDHHVTDTLANKELKFHKSDIYPEPPPRLSIK